MVSGNAHSPAGSYISKLVFISNPTLLIPVDKKKNKRNGNLSDNIEKVERFSVWLTLESKVFLGTAFSIGTSQFLSC